MQYAARALPEEPPPADTRCETASQRERWPAIPVIPGGAPARGIRRILVPTDFSPASTKALQLAVQLGIQCHASVALLHVVDINAPVRSGRAADLMDGMWSEAVNQMGQLAWSLSGRVEVQTTVEEGLPWERIVEKSKDADLVILAHSGAKEGWKLFSQHTAKRVLEDACCPVWVVSEGGLISGKP